VIGSPADRPRGIARTREDELLFVGMLELVSKQPCTCLSLRENEKPCIVCRASTRKAELERERKAGR
jgi:hypothetical protein